MQKKIRMLAIDLDGTLLRGDNTASPYTKKILTKARERGVRIVIATGRMFCSAREVAASLELGDVPLISYSGGLIAKCESGTILYHSPIPVETANELLVAAREIAGFVQVYINDELRVPVRNELVDFYEAHCRIEANIVGDHFWQVTEAPTKIIFNEPDAAKMETIKEYMKAHFTGKVNFVQSSPRFFEMVAPHVSKGVAVEQLCLRYGLSAGEVMAFGNANNDAGMLRMAGWPVAVANATDELKALARIIAPSNEEDGVAKTVVKYVLEDKDGK